MGNTISGLCSKKETRADFKEEEEGRAAEDKSNLLKEKRKIVLAIGNEGSNYTNTRHNIGKLFLEWLAEKDSLGEWQTEKYGKVIETEDVVYIQSNTFMNRSGNCLSKYEKLRRVGNHQS